MPEREKFDLVKILTESTRKLAKKFPDAQKYLIEVATDDMQTHLTSSQTSTIAESLLDKVGFEREP
jgi:hypothetical protein